MTLISQIEKASGDPAGLERLYRQALTSREETAFKSAMALVAERHPQDVLLSAWTFRLDLHPSPEILGSPSEAHPSLARRWVVGIGLSVVLGLASVWLARGKPPAPIPGEADPLFWLGWAPLITLGILTYLAVVHGSRQGAARYFGMAMVVVAVAVYAAVFNWHRVDDVAILCAQHLPVVAFGTIGAALMLVHPEPVRQCYAFLVKSAETVLTGAIYSATGFLFLALTCGIFAALGVEIPEAYLQRFAAWAIGALPLLALTSVYDPAVRPAAQDGSAGLSRILRIVAQLLLPLALAVLVVYELWFVPAHFWKPFQEREVLIVYNATILAILVLLTVLVSGDAEERSRLHDQVLRYGVVSLSGLTTLLNVYALAAILSRIYQFGLTPNRYAVLGWNIVTLLMLGVVVYQLWRRRLESWTDVIRESIARVAWLAVAWALWTIMGLPWSFD